MTCVRWITTTSGAQECTHVQQHSMGFGLDETGAVEIISAIALLFVGVFMWRQFRRVL